LIAASAAAPGRPRSPFLLAAFAFVVALAGVACGAAIYASGGVKLRAPTPLAIAGNRLEIVRGNAQRTGDAMVIEALAADRAVIVSARLSPSPAEAYARVEWQIETNEQHPAELTLLWATREQPGRTFSKSIDWHGERSVRVTPTANEGWRGSIIGVGLAVRGPSTAPLALRGVTLAGNSLVTGLKDLATQWLTFYPFRGITITLPFDEEREQTLPLVPATAIAIVLAVGALAFVGRKRTPRLDARVVWTLVLVGWLVVDLRWQGNLGWQLRETARRYAGKSVEEKYLALDDRELYTLIRDVRAVLPPPPARVLFLADDYALRTRGSYFFYPHNVYHDLARVDAPPAPSPEQLRAGDYIVLFLTRQLAYDPQGKALVWPDGRRKAVDEVRFEDKAPLVLRIR
jgi:hypothetical protein